MILEYTVFDGFVTALAVMLLGCAFGVPALAILSEIAGIVRQKVFMDKFARQAARLGLLFIFSVLLGVAGAWAISIGYLENSGVWIKYDKFWDFSLYLCVIGLVLHGLYYFLWDKLRRIKAFHLFLGALGAVAMILFLALMFWAVYRELMILPEIFPQPDSIFLPMLAQTFLLIVSASAVLTMLYLLLRRNRDDFGRDYYRFALSFAARWALFFAVISPVTCVWLFLVMDKGFDMTYTALPGGIFALSLIVLALVLWRLIRSSQPMRNKAAISLCPLLIWVILVFRLVSYMEFTSMASDKTVIHTFVRDWPILF